MVWVFVDNRLVEDVHGLLSVFKSVQGLLETGTGWADAGYHLSVRITSQRILNNPGEFRVSVRDKDFA